jgi:hypothetical protein
MKILAIICNIILFGFTCLVIVTDGPAQGAGYVVFSFLLLLVPIISAVVLFRFSMSRMMKSVAVVCNIVLLGFAAWAIVSQYPHPEEEGVVAYTVLVVLTPILSIAALLRSRVRQKEIQKAKTFD